MLVGTVVVDRSSLFDGTVPLLPQTDTIYPRRTGGGDPNKCRCLFYFDFIYRQDVDVNWRICGGWQQPNSKINQI
jgi:hypothetical protein